jgi:predicted  nucleic acid-binding Zn-ribbon protein
VSFVDPDLRRLLDIANLLNRNSNIEHYIIREKYDLKQTKDKLREILSTDTDLYNEKLDSQFELDELASELIKIMQKFQETDALSFNVSTIWVNNYTSDIPEILKNIRKTK